MNQVNPKTAYETPGSALKLSEADAKFLQHGLVSGEHAIARQKDIVEMHKRIVGMFTTLNTGIGEQQKKKWSEDREILVHKLEEMESAVNGMEAVLRIEMAPRLDTMVDEAVTRRLPKKKSRWLRSSWLVLGMGIGLVAGVIYSEQSKEVLELAVTQISLFISSL